MPTLRWLTRDDDVCAPGKVPYRLLEEVPELGHGARDAGNMLIQGDNLEALKALLPYYAGQVKCIYIDPPYNTGSAFEHYDDNLEHSQWLAMMWPRLELPQSFTLSRLRHFQLSVRLCRTALPEPGQVRHSLEFPPAFWVSSSLGYED